jgi:hypothetical protein
MNTPLCLGASKLKAVDYGGKMLKFSLLMAILVVVFAGCAAPVMADGNGISLQSPEDGGIIYTLTPVLAWGSSIMASYYSIQVASDPNFQRMVINRSNLPTPAYSLPPDILNHATYYWRVSANLKGNTSGWSEISSFTVSKTAGGTISVNAMLDGTVWAGNIDCSIVGPLTTSVCNRVPEQYEMGLAGYYTLIYNGGGPTGASLSNITPAPTLDLSTGDIMNFTLNFTRNKPQGNVSIYATLNGLPLSTSLTWTLSGPYTETAYNVPTSRYNLSPGTYYLNYNYGAPGNSGLSGILPSSSQFLPDGGTIAFTMQFNSGGYYPGGSYPGNAYPYPQPPIVVVPPPVVVVPPGRPPIAQPPQLPPVQPIPPVRPPAVQPTPLPSQLPNIQPVQPARPAPQGVPAGVGGGGRR